MSNSTTIVPLVLWGKSPPTHSVNVVTCTYDQKTIITGTLHGQIGLWDLRPDQNQGLKVVARNLLFAHGCKVVDIACALDSSFERPNIVSLAENGEMCLWDIEDGLCLQMNVIPGAHTRLYSIQIPRGGVKEWRLVCHGLYAEIHIIDSLTLQILYTLKSRISPNWISAVCFLRTARKQEGSLVGITVSNCLKVWTLLPTNENKNEVIYEEESKTIDCLKAKYMCSNPFTQRTLLVVTSENWKIYDSGDFNFLSSVKAPGNTPLTCGDFVATDRVIVWNKMGKAFLYKLPPSYLLGDQQHTEHTEKCEQPPALICQFHSPQTQTRYNSSLHFSYGRRSPYFKLLIQGINGGLCVWRVPDSEQSDLCTPLHPNAPSYMPSTEAVLVEEGARKFLNVQNQNTRVVEHIALITLKDLWKVNSPIGLNIDNLEGSEEGLIGVTCSLYLPSQGKMVCGRANGSIVIVDTIRAAFSQLLQRKKKDTSSPFTIITGHTAQVTCLLYPHDENPRYDKTYLISGSADFTVRAWDLKQGALLHRFSCHGGEVIRLLVTPPECNSRFAQCVCSVAQDHSVAVVGLRERKLVLLAARHTFPVETIRWRVNEDFMVVGCSDGTVYVWQMETGHLDRCVAGAVAYKILESCNEETSAPSAAVREHQRKFRIHRHLTNMPIKTPQMVKKMKNKMVSLHNHVTGHNKHNHQQINANGDTKTAPLSLPPIRVCALQASNNDPNMHVILLDAEALIKQLLFEEADYYANSDQPINPKRYQHHDPTEGSHQRSSSSVPYEVAQLLLSCCHGWGLDVSLDDICANKLGIVKPVKPLSFGLLTRGRLALMFPGWYIDEETAGSEEEVTINQTTEFNDSKIEMNSHWQLSSSLTTQHLISLVAVTNTLMSMNYVTFNNKHDSQMSSIRSEVKAGWSLLAALHCCMLPDAMKGLMYRPPLLHVLARRWQDRCLEIREAAQAILLAELQRIGPMGRKQLIDAWAPHLPQDLDTADFGFEDLEQYVNVEDEKTVFVNAEEDRTDIAMVMMTTRKMVSSDLRLRHATAIIMLGVIGAEFQREMDPLNKDNKSSQSCMDVNVVRTTAKALTTLLLRRQGSNTPAYSAIRRAAIDLIGRGFALWEPHIDVSQVLIGLFELCGDIEQQLKGDRIRHFSISAAKDLHRSAKHSLSLIASARPSACITTLAKEVARHVASTSSMSFTQPSPAAIAVYSHVRQQASTNETPASTVLHNARGEIMRVMEHIIDKSQQQVIEFIVEVVDIIVHLLDFKQIKERGLTEICPALFKFGMVSYCSHTRRLAVGSKIGHIALYELRSSRCQIIPAHDSAISALAFSPEGKVLSSFSYRDRKINFYQTSSSLLGMLSSTIKCIHSYNTILPDNPHATKTVRILWTSKKHVILLLGDGSQHKFTI